MMWASVAMLAALLGVIGAAWARGQLAEGFRASARGAVVLGPMLLLAVFIMGFTEVLLPQDWVERWLTDASGPRGLLVGWLAGLLTPGGGVVGFPLAAGLLKTGASPAVVVTYLTSMATLNLLRLPMEAGYYGLRVMTLRALACAVLPFLAGGIARLLAPWLLPNT
jgi:uncharacterized membrane protein YraQ (UPF0718 family)